MARGSRRLARLWFGLAAVSALATARAEPVDPSSYSDLRWRLVGPFRGGWATCAVGVPDDHTLAGPRVVGLDDALHARCLLP